ncbi:carboxylesterase family protein [Galactobacter valiniphilus]|uniref:carboxylesterase family protein n=1 Tax=Galactobacter valiniphilus TaxID=2676122 RepID=UPI0037368E99
MSVPGLGPGTSPLTVVAAPEAPAAGGAVGTLEAPDVVLTRCRWARLAYPERRTSRAIPVAPAAPGEVEDAVLFPQSPGGMDWLLGAGAAALDQDDDAFQVTVAAPAGAAGAGLLIFLPGGGFVSGGASLPVYDAAALARATGRVVMVPGYRLGAHGALGRAKDGTPLLVDDVLRAVAWCLEHSAHFGASTEDVTLAGQSAGAWCALVAAQDPALAASVTRLALYSLPFQPPPGPEGRAERQAVVDDALDGRTFDELSPAEAVDVSAALNRAWAGRGLGVQPPSGGRLPASLLEFETLLPRLRVREALLAHTRDEARAMIPPMAAAGFPEPAARGYERSHFAGVPAAGDDSPWERMTAAMTEHEFAGFSRELGAALAAAGVRVHRSRWDVECGVPGAGAAHCTDLPGLFGFAGSTGTPMLAGVDPEGFAGASERWRSPLIAALAGALAPTAPGTLVAVGPAGSEQVTDASGYVGPVRGVQA